MIPPNPSVSGTPFDPADAYLDPGIRPSFSVEPNLFQFAQAGLGTVLLLLVLFGVFKGFAGEFGPVPLFN